MSIEKNKGDYKLNYNRFWLVTEPLENNIKDVLSSNKKLSDSKEVSNLDDIIKWFTKKKAKELESILSLNEISSVFENVSKASINGHFNAFYRKWEYDVLVKFVNENWDNVIKWLTKEKLDSMKKEVDKIIWVPQKWEFLNIENGKAYFLPNNNDHTVTILNDPRTAELSFWDSVEFVIGESGLAKINRN